VALGLGPASPPACAVRVIGSVCRWRAERFQKPANGHCC
jgi:hypothetical protein